MARKAAVAPTADVRAGVSGPLRAERATKGRAGVNAAFLKPPFTLSSDVEIARLEDDLLRIEQAIDLEVDMDEKDVLVARAAGVRRQIAFGRGGQWVV
jgi:hypothetical protein